MSQQHRHEPGDGPHDLAAPYALDALSDLEREAFEAHLSDCPACRDEVAQLREAAVVLSEGMELAPPADLRRRVLAQVAAEGRPPTDLAASRAATRRPRRGWLLAAAAALAVGAGAWGATELLGGQDPATRIVQAQDAQEYEVRTDEGELTVVASVSQDAAVLRLPEDLEAPPQGQVYQAWYVGADGSARSAGLLTEDSLDDGETVLEGALAGAAAVGLTVEPEGGSEQPTSEPFAVVPLD